MAADEQLFPLSPTQQAERAASDLRLGLPVILRGEGGEWLAQAAESLDDEGINHALGLGAPLLAISAAKAKDLGLPETPTGIRLRDAAAARALIQALAKGSRALAPDAETVTPETEIGGVLRLASYMGILPLLVLVRLPAGRDTANLTAVSPAGIDAFFQQTLRVRKVSEARVPLAGVPEARVVAFRAAVGAADHLAVVIGRPEGQEAPLVRVHSSCITGDILGSLRCDCGSQLDNALSAIAREGHGVLVYLNQEGRGIGIASKLRAYGLQDAGMDTVEANEALGFAMDERDFRLAAAILRQVGVTRLRLLTNNPRKVEVLRQAGLEVTERVRHAVAPNGVNDRYLAAKREKCGHDV